jgi:hypothetical protein
MPVCWKLVAGVDTGCQIGVEAIPLARIGVVETLIEQANASEIPDKVPDEISDEVGNEIRDKVSEAVPDEICREI